MKPWNDILFCHVKTVHTEGLQPKKKKYRVEGKQKIATWSWLFFAIRDKVKHKKIKQQDNCCTHIYWHGNYLAIAARILAFNLRSIFWVPSSDRERLQLPQLSLRSGCPFVPPTPFPVRANRAPWGATCDMEIRQETHSKRTMHMNWGLLHIEKRGMGGRARRGTKQRGAAENTRKAIIGAFESIFSSAILRRFLDQNPDSWPNPMKNSQSSEWKCKIHLAILRYVAACC